MRTIRVIIFLIVMSVLFAGLASKDTYSLVNDSELSTGNVIEAWVSTEWLQTTQSDFQAGVSSNTDTATSPDNVIISLVPNLTLITADNNTVQTDTSSSMQYQWVKTLNFTKSGSSYNELRIDSNMKGSAADITVSSSIRVDEVEKFTHSVQSVSYISYSDVFDFSGYADGPHTIKLYMSVSGGLGYNYTFEVYRTSPVLVSSDNNEVSTTGDVLFHLMKTLTFTKSGSDYNNLRIDSNLKATGNTAYSSIRVDDVELFTHSTGSTSYVSYSDFLDFSGYSDGSHTVKLYLKIGNKNQMAYNSLFELYRTTPVLITSDNREVSITGTLEYQLLKTLNFTKIGSSYNELRIDSNLKATSPSTASSSIRVDDVEKFTHSTTSTSYVDYSDTLDFSSYGDGVHSVKLYMKSSNKNQAAYNSKLEIYRTKTFAASGTIASQVLDTSRTSSRWDALSWSEILGTGTDITFEMRASDTPFVKNADTPTWTPFPGNSILQTSLPSGQYKQWRATLTTDVTRTYTPTLQNVVLYYAYR